MPKLKCDCGTIIDLGGIPSPNKWLIVSDIAYDEYMGSVDAEELYAKMQIMVKCKVCDRLHIYWDDYNQPPTTYFLQNKR